MDMLGRCCYCLYCRTKVFQEFGGCGGFLTHCGFLIQWEWLTERVMPLCESLTSNKALGTEWDTSPDLSVFQKCEISHLLLHAWSGLPWSFSALPTLSCGSLTCNFTQPSWVPLECSYFSFDEQSFYLLVLDKQLVFVLPVLRVLLTHFLPGLQQQVDTSDVAAELCQQLPAVEKACEMHVFFHSTPPDKQSQDKISGNRHWQFFSMSFTVQKSESSTGLEMRVPKWPIPADRGTSSIKSLPWRIFLWSTSHLGQRHQEEKTTIL